MIWYDFAVIQKKVKVHKHRVLYLVMFFRGLKVDSCVFLIFTTRVGLKIRLNGVKSICFEQSRKF